MRNVVIIFVVTMCTAMFVSCKPKVFKAGVDVVRKISGQAPKTLRYGDDVIRTGNKIWGSDDKKTNNTNTYSNFKYRLK